MKKNIHKTASKLYIEHTKGHPQDSIKTQTETAKGHPQNSIKAAYRTYQRTSTRLASELYII